MNNNIIREIKFTATELDILSCFTDLSSSKPSTISQILDKPTSTIYTHLDKIKGKINAQSIGDISRFIKQSSEYRELKRKYLDLYIDYQFRLTANKIAYYVKKSQITYSLSMKSCSMQKKATEEIFHKILYSCGLDNKANGAKNLFIQILDENEQAIQASSANFKIILNEDSYSVKSATFYYNGNKKELYKFFVNYLQKIIPELSRTEECIKFANNVDNIKNNILTEITSSRFLPSATSISKKTNKKAMITIALLLTVLSALFSVLKKYNNNQFTTEEVYPRKSGEILAFNLPPRNKKFTGRENHLREIKSNLSNFNLGIITQSIIGTGGIGKTQLATEYTYRAIENKEYDAILWLSAETNNDIVQSYIEIANKLHININDLSQNQIISIVNSTLINKHQAKNILFILDNVTNKKSIQKYLQNIHEQFSIKTQPHIIITSRSQAWDANLLYLDIFTNDEAENFVISHLPKEDSKSINQLITTLNHYPLALAQAVGYIKQHSNIDDYLQLYNLKKEKYLNIFSEDMNQYRKTIWCILSVTLSKLNQNAKNMLFMSSYLEPDNIQLNLFSNISIEDKMSSINALRQHSLIMLTNKNKSFKIHRLVQETLRLHINNTTSYIDTIAELATKIATKFGEGDNKSIWQQAREWNYHINSIAKYINDPKQKINLLDTYSNIAHFFGLYELSKEYNLSSIKAKELHYNENSSIKILDNLIEIGSLEWWLGNYHNSKEFLIKARNIIKDNYEDGASTKLMKIFNILSLVEYRLGKYEKALDLSTKAFDIFKAHKEKLCSMEEVSILNRLAIANWGLGDSVTAKKLLTKSLNIITKEDHIRDVAYLGYIKNNLGLAEWDSHNYSKAKKLITEALNIFEARYNNPQHISMAFSQYYLSRLNEEMGDYIQSSKYLSQSYDIWLKYYVHNHKEKMAHFYSPAIQWVNLHMKNPKAALKYFTDSLKIVRLLFGDNHFSVARHYFYLGQAFEKANNIHEAKNLYKESLSIAKNSEILIHDTRVLKKHRKNMELVNKRLLLLEGKS